MTSIIKLVLLGESGVGKTSLIKKYILDKFDSMESLTIGALFMQKLIKHIQNDKEYNLSLHVWDTAGQERFKSMIPMYIRGAKVCLLVFDGTIKYNYKKYFEQWENFIDQYKSDNMLLYYIGTKCDLLDEKSIEEIKKTLYNIGINKDRLYFVSSKNGDNMNGLFNNIYTELINNNIINNNKISVVSNKNVIKIDNEEYNTKKYYCC